MQKHVEVLIAATIPEVWKVVKKIPHIATQKKNSADADYIAFFRVGLRDKNMKSAITHIAKVKGSNNEALIKEHFRKNPILLRYSKAKGKKWEHNKYHKEYYLEKIQELSEPIKCRKGEGRRCQVKLYTTREELDKAEYLGDIKTVSNLEREKRDKKNSKNV